MNENKIKDFWNKHKKELIIGGCVVTGTVITVMVGKRMKAPNFDRKFTELCETNNNIKRLVEFCDVCDKFKGDAKHYVPISGDEFRELTSDAVLRSGDGSLNEVVGGILFTKAVGEVKEI